MNLKIYIFYLLILHSCLTAQRGRIEGIVVDVRHHVASRAAGWRAAHHHGDRAHRA